jgi:pilus assembly protein Flp/PilA
VDLIAYWQKHCVPYIRARLGRNDEGASLVEYALLVALIAVVCIAAITLLGGNASKKFSQIGSAVQ